MSPLASADSSRTNPKLTIVLADNMPEHQLRLRRWLEDEGHTVVGVASGNEAIRVTSRLSIDLAITGMFMPDGDGLEFMVQLKRTQPAARVIAMSGGGHYLGLSDCLKVAQGLGASDTLVTPVDRPDLLAALVRVTAPAEEPVAIA